MKFHLVIANFVLIFSKLPFFNLQDSELLLADYLSFKTKIHNTFLVKVVHSFTA